MHLSDEVDTNDRFVARTGSLALPSFVKGCDTASYGIANLASVAEVGMHAEFSSMDPLYTSRETFAMRIGYVGTQYTGYQTQNKAWDGLVTVEDDLRKIIGGLPTGAGRTDKGNILCYCVDVDASLELRLDLQYTPSRILSRMCNT